MDDGRINLFGRDPPRDPFDFDDPSERETPQLSASSMASSSRHLEWDNGADIGGIISGWQVFLCNFTQWTTGGSTCSDAIRQGIRSTLTTRRRERLRRCRPSSSRRLEWDNGADIGYSIAILRPTRVIPDVARSDPEGISLMNDTLNMGGASPFPYFSFGSVSNSSNFVMDQGNETMADASSQISIQSSGSQSLSDSRKSVIYNSVRDMRRRPWMASKSLSSTNGSPRLQRRSFRNLSCPELTDLRRDWLTRNDFLVSKSEEALKTYIFPGLVAQRLRTPPFGVGRSSSIESEDRQNKGDILTGSSQGSSFQNVSRDVVVSSDPFLDMSQGHEANNTKALPINQPPTHYYDRGDVPTERSEMHVCKNCQGPIHLAAEQISQNEDHFHTEIEESDYYPPYEGDPMSPTIEWTNPETYVDEFARPILVVSNNASKLEGRTDLSKIVGSFFGSQDTDNSGGHSEVKPHIRWYPFTPNQDIKDVSTQTSVSFVAQQQSKDAVTTRAVFAQQTSCPDESIVEPDVFGLPEKQGSGKVYNLQGDSNKFSQISGIRGKNDSDSREVSGVSASETQTVAQQSPSIRSPRTPSLSSVFLMPDNSLQSNILNERNIPGETNSNVQGIFGASTTEAKSLNRNISSQAYSHRSSSICNLESEFLPPENLQVSRGSNSQENDSQTTGTGQTCVSCHTDINASDDHESRVVPSSKDRLQQTMTTNSQNSLNAYYSSNTENNSTVDMEQLVSLFSERPSVSVSSSGVALMNPRGERKLGVGECQGNSSIRQNNSTTAKSLFVQESLSTNTEKFPVQKSSNTRNLVAAVDQRSAIQQGSEGNLTDENFQRNFVRTSINTLNTFQDLVATGSRISIPGSNVRTIQASNVNNTKDLTHLENNLSSNVNLQRGSIRESHNISCNKTTYSTDIKNNIPFNINTQRVKVNEIQAATGNRTRNTSNFNNNLSSNAGHMIQSRFPASATNLLDFLSSNRPFSDSKYLEQKEGIPKSFSDPLIAGPQSDSSSEEDSGLVTFRSHAYEESSAGPNPQSVGYQPRQDLQKEHFKSHGSNSPEVLFQGSTNYVLQEESVAFTNQNVLPTEIQNPKRSGNSQQSFIASQQVNQSTSMKDASVDAIRKEYEGQSRSNSLSPHRGLSLGKLESEDFISHQISSRKQGNFSDAATSPINVGSLSLHFPQASTNKIEDSSDTNTWRMREHILRKSSVDSQIQTDTDKHYQRPPYKHSSTLPKDSSGIRHKEHERRHKELEIRQPEHEMRHQGSANRLQEHESKHQEPEIRHQEHQIRHKQHQIRHRKHEIRHQEHESKHQEPEIRHQEHQIRHKQHQIRHQEHEIRHRELEMKHQGQEVRLQGHENRQQEHQIEHKQPDNRHQELETRHQQPKLRHQEPEMRHQQPDYRNQATDIRYTTGHPNDRGRIVDREIGSPKLSSSRYEMDPETINSKSQQDCPKQDGGRSRTSSTSYSVKDDSLKQTPFRPRSGSNSFQHRDLYSAKRDPLASSNQNFASVGVQVSSEYSQGKNLESEKCSFCNQSKASHPIQCPKREAFKVVLGRALDKGKGTSYCVYSNACKCCCDKTLQEAFNFHRAEIIERIEARQKEVETKTTKSLFLNLASPATSQQKSNKTSKKVFSIFSIKS
ncbi:hypothetical protein JTE90_020517 [Oedothorax gibbosus]|uniref:Uncharacterized protein n=1 Tax=Oedothorax gibbosus TaxID=931172 RepID=A0AAV6TMW2_9ARAC|nr:hypothetical protein JTE90_020517 [Oedothorax gibbosus]